MLVSLACLNRSFAKSSKKYRYDLDSKVDLLWGQHWKNERGSEVVILKLERVSGQVLTGAIDYPVSPGARRRR
jgi:hypothetical protein